MVLLNFSQQTQLVSVPFPDPGTYTEVIDTDAQPPVPAGVVSQPNQFVTVAVPSNYGRIYLLS